VHGQGLCGKHYQRKAKYGHIADPTPPPDTCTLDGCESDHYANGWCQLHYMRWWRTGTTETAAKRTPEQRFWDRVDKDGPLPTWAPFLGSCWLWTAGKFPAGYGCLGVGGKSVLTHRFSYELLVGPIPEGLEIDHLCRVRACCNPSHLEPVTSAENVQRARLVAA